MVKININGEFLDVPDSLSLSIEEQNPIFGERGSQSLPATLPATPRNKRLLGFPNRLEVTTSMPALVPVTVSCGAYIRSGLLNIVDAGNDSITVNIGFDNSVGYAEWQSTKLRDLASIVETETPTPADMDGFPCSPDSLFCAFPVVLDIETYSGANGNEIEIPVTLNMVDTWTPETVIVNRVINKQLYNETVPRRYAWSPFVKVFYLLERIFAGLGVTLSRYDNPFYAGGRDLRRLVVLNNCADSCCLETVKLRDLVPDCTVQEFLDCLWKKFGFAYRLNIDAGTVSAALVEDLIAAGSTNDLTKYISNYPTISFAEPQYLKLIARTSLDNAAPPTARYPDFVRARVLSFVLDDPRDDDDEIAWTDFSNPIDITEDMVGKDKTWGKSDFSGASINWTIKGTERRSCFFNWDPEPSGFSSADIEAGDESVPLLSRSLKEGGKWTGHAPFYRVGAVHYHTKIDPTMVETAGVQSSTPVAFMFAYTKDGMPLGRPAPITDSGEVITETDEGSEVVGQTLFYDFPGGIFSSFWRRYDLLLRHGARTAACSAVMSPLEILNLNPLMSARISGTDALIESVSYSLGHSYPIPVSMTLRPLTLRGDFDADQEQQVSNFSPTASRLAWVGDATVIYYYLIDRAFHAEARKIFEQKYSWENIPNGFRFDSDQIRSDFLSFRFKRWVGEAPQSPTIEQFEDNAEYEQEAVFELKYLVYVKCYPINGGENSPKAFWLEDEISIEVSRVCSVFPRRVFS